MKDYFYRLLAGYIRLFARDDDSLVDLDPMTELGAKLDHARQVKLDQVGAELSADYVLLNGNLHYERDVQSYLARVRRAMKPEGRLLVVYYSSLWRPVLALATRLGLRSRLPEWNWLAHGDVENFLRLANFEVVTVRHQVLMPVYVPILSNLINRFIAPLPFFSSFCLVNVLVARPVAPTASAATPSVSVVVPARNEAGNIEAIIRRIPRMGPNDEVIFVEGGSSDDTWERIRALERESRAALRVIATQQDGKGKGDAVRKGFNLASNEILMILDADLTVPPEDLPKFYHAIASGAGEFINGSRLVYPMERRAMRFLNLLANKFFAAAFSFVIGQRFKDTLCGTKVISRTNYERLSKNRKYFGEFDPFGDFDLIFGAARMGLRIVEVPIIYRERTYGTTNISRWRHGVLLFTMLFFAARRLLFV